jgi:hypothetical protein
VTVRVIRLIGQSLARRHPPVEPGSPPRESPDALVSGDRYRDLVLILPRR